MLSAAAERCAETETRFVELSKPLQGWKDEHSQEGFSHLSGDFGKDEVIDVPPWA
jgi:hypothetical protein